MTRQIIAARNLSKVFQVGDAPLLVLNQVSLSIPQGQFVSIMGPSGSGKSTLLYLLGGLDYPSAGDIYVAGNMVSALNRDELAAFRSRTIGFVFQAFHLIPTLTALENVGLPGIFLGMPSRDRQPRAAHLLNLLVGDRMDHRPSQLSGGQQQRVALARALFNHPPILMCDEPTGALDSKTGQAVMRMLRILCDKQKKTVIVVTHDPSIAEYSDRIVMLQDGQIIDDHIIASRKAGHHHVA